VFGYELGDMSGDGFRYATLKVGGGEVGGIGELGSSVPAEVPAHWEDVLRDQPTPTRPRQPVSAAGGQVIQPPRDSPFGRNRGGRR